MCRISTTIYQYTLFTNKKSLVWLFQHIEKFNRLIWCIYLIGKFVRQNRQKSACENTNPPQQCRTYLQHWSFSVRSSCKAINVVLVARIAVWRLLLQILPLSWGSAGKFNVTRKCDEWIWMVHLCVQFGTRNRGKRAMAIVWSIWSCAECKGDSRLADQQM